MTQVYEKLLQYLHKLGLVILVLLGLISIIATSGHDSLEIDFGGGDVDDRIYPTVTTLPATNVLPHSALLQGAVNPNGVETTTYFLWGGHPTLSDSIDASGINGSGTSTINFSNDISQLSSDTQYYFMVGAYTVEYASASGAVLDFKTPYAVEPYWARSYGGEDDEYPTMISLVTDGGYLITGSTDSTITALIDNNLNTQMWVIRLNSDGKVVWQKQYHNLLSVVDSGAGIQLSNGDFVIASNNYLDDDSGLVSYPWIARLDMNGSIVTQRILGRGRIKTVIVDGSDNLLIIGFYLDTTGKKDYWLVKLNSSGEILWQKTYGTTQTNDLVSSIAQTTNGYMITGSMNDRSWLLEVDGQGNILWQKLYSCNDLIDLPINGVVYDPDDGYVLLGNGSTLLAAKVGLDGSVQWVRKYGLGRGKTIIHSGDGGYVIGGRHGNTNGLIKIDKSGNIIWSKVYGASSGTVLSARLDVNNDIVFTSYMDTYNSYDIQVVKLPANGSLPPISTDITLTPEDMECSFQEDTFVSASTISSVTSSASVSPLNTFATVLQQAP